MIGFLECLKRERDICIKSKKGGGKRGFRCSFASTTSFSKNPRCNRHPAKKYREINEFNTSARIINENSNFMTLYDENKLSAKTRLDLVESKKMRPTWEERS